MPGLIVTLETVRGTQTHFCHTADLMIPSIRNDDDIVGTAILG
jgi:hypothetical protein